MRLGRVLAALAAVAIVPAQAQAGQPVVVELFTSQGCSSCPPADANLGLLAGRADVVALSFGVTYWDRLGWKDTFAQAAFTERQKAYGRALGLASLYTPQMVVNGTVDTPGFDRQALERLIDRAAALRGPAIGIGSDAVALEGGAAPRAPADVWLVRYDPAEVQVPIARGENAGVTLPLRNVVRSLDRLGAWDGRAVRFDLPAGPQGLATAILVQARDGGPILAAAKG
jgi:hypothetical protein